MKKVYIYSSLLLLIDITTKIIIINTMQVNEKVTIVKTFFSLWYVKNSGAAFGFMQDSRLLLVVIASIVLGVLLNMLSKEKKRMPIITTIVYSMLIAGIAGNLIDRLIHHYVIDYFSFQIMGYLMPIFNIADMYIFISLVIYLIMNFKGKEVFRK